MACFIVPAAEAVVSTIASKVIKIQEVDLNTHSGNDNMETTGKMSFSHKLHWLSNLLWGGAVLLAFEHIWHGEVVPWFPFLTAASNPSDFAEMLHEMSTIGVTMAVLITVVWVGMLLSASVMEKHILKPQVAEK